MQASESLGWEGYELLASGEGRRIERWGTHVTDRPESSAHWRLPSALPERDGTYTGDKASGGSWIWRREPDPGLVVSRGPLRFLIRPTSSKHVGLFPEQAANWDWMSSIVGEQSSRGKRTKVLNLFGYTGGATLAAAIAGAAVTHVDASRAMVSWCSENAGASGLAEAPIRYIVEDAMVFLGRELRRGNRYDGIIMDPPAYGRGRRGELWKLTDQLGDLLDASLGILGDHPLFLLLNTYSAPAEEAVGEIVRERLGSRGKITEVPLTLSGSLDGRVLPCGMARRWTGIAPAITPPL